MCITTVMWVFRVKFWLYARIFCTRVCDTSWVMMLISSWLITICYTVLVFHETEETWKQIEIVIISRNIFSCLVLILKKVLSHFKNSCILQEHILNEIFESKTVCLFFISCWYSEKKVYDFITDILFTSSRLLRKTSKKVNMTSLKNSE